MKGEPTFIEPPLHRPRRCPGCRKLSTAIIGGRCQTCRTATTDRLAAVNADLARAVWTAQQRARWLRPPGPPTSHVPPDPVNCSGCGRATYGLADGLCLTCRMSRT